MIEVRGYVMRGYIGAAQRRTTAALTADGFFRTGDMGHADRERAISFRRPHAPR